VRGAKTTTFKATKDIVDPSSVGTRPFDKNANDLIQIAEHHFIVIDRGTSFKIILKHSEENKIPTVTKR
jgi:hypothetical protein